MTKRALPEGSPGFRYHLEKGGGKELGQLLRVIRYRGWRILSN